MHAQNLLMSVMGLIGREVVLQRKEQEFTERLEAGELKIEELREQLEVVKQELAQQRHLTTYLSVENARVNLLRPVQTASAPASPLPVAARFAGFNLHIDEAGASDEAGAAHGRAVGRSLGATAVLTMTTLTMAGATRPSSGAASGSTYYGSTYYGSTYYGSTYYGYAYYSRQDAASGAALCRQEL